MNGVRINGERRARLYEQFMDAPGQAMRDWWIIAQIAQRMGFSGFDWKSDEEVFTELAPNAQYDASGIVQYAMSVNKSPYTVLRGLQNGVEINPADAARLGVQSGDMISLESSRVVTQQPGTFDKGSFTAVAYVSDIVPQGVVFTNFAYPDQWFNSISPRWMHPANPVPPYKLSRARLTRIGSTDLASRMSFAPRNLV